MNSMVISLAANRFGISLYSTESFLHYPSVLSKWGCVMYSRKVRSV